MYTTRGGGDANVPPLPVRRSAVRQTSGTPQLPPHQQVMSHQRSTTTTTTVAPEVNLSSSSTSSISSSSPSSSSRLNLTNLDRRVDLSHSRTLNHYHEFPTATSTSRPQRPGQEHPVDSSSPETVLHTSSTLLRDVGRPQTRIDDENYRRKKTSGSKTRSPVSECRDTIICQRCGRCRCQECARHRAPGQRVVEVCSCVSCARRVVGVRHRSYDSDDDDEGDDAVSSVAHLCSCSPRRSDCRRRWARLVVLSFFVPCLCLYWPLRCAVGACSRCAGRRVRGCRCVERTGPEFSHVPSSPTESVVMDRVTST